MKFSTVAAALLLFLFQNPSFAQTPDPYDRLVPHVHAYESFDEALHVLEKTTGLKVICPSDTLALTRKIWSKGKFMTMRINGDSPEIGLRMFVDEVCSDFGLQGKLHPEEGSLTIDIPWRTSDPRPSAELLRSVLRHDHGPMYSTEINAKWRAEFDALLCKSGNFEKAAPVRQTQLRNDFPLLSTPITGADGERYFLTLFVHPLLTVPGNGSASYYWFREDGTLAGAGLMNTGNRCLLVDVAIGNESEARSKQVSELQMILKRDPIGFVIGRFVLKSEGLKLVYVNDATGKEMERAGFDIGRSLLEK